ncbi:MAG: carbohydrate ABC transporter permease [Pseudomonadota bacterium]
MSDASIPRAMRQPTSLKLASNAFLLVWLFLAAFPLLWVLFMSFKSPVDAFSSSAWEVITGPRTLSDGSGISIVDIILFVGVAWMSIKAATLWLMPMAAGDGTLQKIFSWAVIALGFAILAVLGLFFVVPLLAGPLESLLGPLGRPIIGMTTQHYEAVWVENAFYENFRNSMIVTFGVVTVSLTVGTLAGYGLARSGSTLAFWILIIALIFRALPHSVLVAGYLPVFINSAELLSPILGENAPTLYGQPLAVIAVLVSINQPFTIWMLRSFFQNIPVDLDESARVDGCTHFQAFRWVIMPVMWPGVITTGLFSFLLAYNDFLVTSLLLDASNQTMVPAIAGYFNRETTTTDQVEAVAAAVSITAPLFLLVMIFQRQIVSGLTAGAVKG